MCALFGRQALKAFIAVHDLVALVGRQTFEVRVLVAQLLLTRLGKLTPLAQPLEHIVALLGW